MSMPFYVAPEQVMKDRADYARKGIGRGRALVAVRFADGIVIVAENASTTLRKISENLDDMLSKGGVQQVELHPSGELGDFIERFNVLNEKEIIGVSQEALRTLKRSMK